MEAASGSSIKEKEQEKRSLYLKEQREGDFLVKAKKALCIHFLSGESAQSEAREELRSFDPLELDLFFGDDQVIKGYEKL